jgi:hypothetical protein
MESARSGRLKNEDVFKKYKEDLTLDCRERRKLEVMHIIIIFSYSITTFSYKHVKSSLSTCSSLTHAHFRIKILVWVLPGKRIVKNEFSKTI